MTKLSSQMVQCPDCGQQQEVVLWDSINVTLDPELKEKLFQGKINIFDCVACHYTTFINYPLLYHDMNRGFLVQYYPFSSLMEDNEFLKMFRKNGKIKMVGVPGTYLEEPHIVFDMNEMLRYILFREKIFEVGQD
ncbi:MAG: CpXC domain-containing protein [Desulfobaccales bacterium]